MQRGFVWKQIHWQLHFARSDSCNTTIADRNADFPGLQAWPCLCPFDLFGNWWDRGGSGLKNSMSAWVHQVLSLWCPPLSSTFRGRPEPTSPRTSEVFAFVSLFACSLAKRPPYTDMGTLCTGKKAPIYGHGDTLHYRKSPHIWAWGQSVWVSASRMHSRLPCGALMLIRHPQPPDLRASDSGSGGQQYPSAGHPMATAATSVPDWAQKGGRQQCDPVETTIS